MSGSLTRLNPATLPDTSRMGYSQISIAEAGRTAYVSGQVALDGNGSVPESLAEQTQLVVRNLQAALDAMDAGVSDIGLLRIYVVDLTEEKLAQSFPIVLEWLAGNRPSITGVGVTALAGAAFKIEIETTIHLQG